MDIYEQLKNANIPLDNHESDLYALKTPESEAIIKNYTMRPFIKTFISQIDGKIWYDIPFAYTPFWAKKSH